MEKLEPCTSTTCTLKKVPAAEVRVRDCSSCGIVSQIIDLMKSEHMSMMGGSLNEHGETRWEIQQQMDRWEAEDNEKQQEQDQDPSLPSNQGGALAAPSPAPSPVEVPTQLVAPTDTREPPQ